MDKYIGKRLDGRYEIKEIIGVGGMAYVYKAYDTIDDRVVAVKILKDEFLANEEFTRRFKNESKAIAILSHPNIVKVYDVSFGERLQYIVMEYIDGITLKEYIEQQKDIRWKEAVHFTVQILRALQHAHDKGIVHRDIKPQNIMLLPDGTIKVTDFGIARFSRTDVRATGASDKAIGSVHYISPEQARGEITDEKADIYSVGVMLYEMLTGRLPFEADNAVSVAIMQLQSEPKMPREINPQIPEGLEDITIKAMQKDPTKRYQSAAEMLYDIDEFKRNPSIHFEYKYFVDETPTRFVETITRVKGDAPQGSQDEEETGEEEQEEEKKGPPVIPILAAVAGAFVLVALIFIGVVFLLGIFKPGRGTDNIVIPKLIGRNYADDIANDASVLAMFSDIQINRSYSSEYEAGLVCDQDPKPGASKKRGIVMTITISEGKKMVQVPDVTEGEDQKSVFDRITNVELVPALVKAASDTVAKGAVIKVEPAYPEKVPVGGTVTVFVSNGPEPVPDEQVPNVVAATQADAIKQLTAKGFVVDESDIQKVNHPTYGAGYVISQSPEGDTMQSPGTRIKLVVSSGYKDISVDVQMPDTNTAVDMQVFVNGRESAEHSNKLKGLLPSAMTQLPQLKFTEQLDTYNVTIRISEAGKNQYTDYIVYTMDGRSGTANVERIYPFTDPVVTTTTTASTTTTANATTTTTAEDDQ